MITKAERTEGVNIILVAAFDRFSRNEEAILTKKRLKSKGIYVVSATQQTDPDSAAGEFVEGMMMQISKFENDLRKSKCMAGMKECLERGYWFSKPPLGYDKRKENRQHIVTVNATGELLRQAFTWKAEGAADVEIVRRLKGMGLAIHKQRLSEIFHNPFYCGKIQHDLLGDKIVQGKQELLVSEELFNKVNGIHGNCGYTHAKETPMYPLKRHLICNDCGHFLTGYEVKAKQCDYYKCNTPGCRSNHNIAKIHTSYADLLTIYTIPQELIPVFKEVLKKVFKERNEGQDQLHKEFSKQVTEYANQIKDINVKYALGKISEEVHKDAIADLKEKKAIVEAELEKVKEKLSNLDKSVDATLQIACKIRDLWQSADFHVRQKLQWLVFPNGVYYVKGNDSYRTDNENSVFATFRKLSTTYKDTCTKKEPLLSDSYGLVAETGLEPATSGL